MGDTLRLAKKRKSYTPEVPMAQRGPDAAAPASEVVGETKFGKELEVFRTNAGKMFGIRFIGGGEMPAELSGRYCRFADAEQAVRVYLERNKSRLSGS